MGKKLIVMIVVCCTILTGCQSKYKLYLVEAKQPELIEKEEIHRDAEDYRTELVRSQLTDEEQVMYDELIEGILGLKEVVSLTTIDEEMLQRVYTCVMLDHPEIFYVQDYYYVKDDLQLLFYATYMYTEEEILARRDEIERQVQLLRQEMPVTEDKYEIVKFVYERLIEETQYNLNAENNQNISSVFRQGQSVCLGYAKAMQYIMQKEDIPCMLILGRLKNGENHAWDLVRLNEKWYYVDITSGEIYYNFDALLELPDDIMNYDYLCINTESLEKTHIVDMPIEIPEHTSIEENYYVKEGLYFTEYDKEKLKDLFNTALKNDSNCVTIKCKDDVLFTEIYTDLFKDNRIFKYLEGHKTISYTSNRDQGIITVWLLY